MDFRLGKRAGETLRGAGALSSVGLAFVLALVIGAWLGRLLDRWAGTSPLFFILFFFFGLAAGILNVYRTVSSAMTPPSSTRSESHPAGKPGGIGAGPAEDPGAEADELPGGGHDQPAGPAGSPRR